MANGIPLGAELRKALDELADRLGVPRCDESRWASTP